MLAATDEEIQHITDYMASQANDREVTFVQKMYAENIHGHVHDVWDVHTDKERWWVITNPTNLYSQDQFPNIDYAVTFHVGLCVRIPRSEKQKISDLPIEPLTHCYRLMAEAAAALVGAQEVADFQAVGVRCREMLLAFTDASQKVLLWSSAEEKPKSADFKAWTDHVCAIVLPGPSHENRRHLFKTLLDSAWKYSNWLTHSKHSNWHDAEAAVSVAENALSLSISKLVQHLRGVPEQCPSCGSFRLSPERARNPENEDETWERAACDKCDWTGEPTLVERQIPVQPTEPPQGKCVVPDSPLRKLKRPI